MAHLGSKQHWHDHIGKHLLVCVNSQKFQSPKRKFDQWGVDCNDTSTLFEFHIWCYKSLNWTLSRKNYSWWVDYDNIGQGTKTYLWWTWCQFINYNSCTLLKEERTIVFIQCWARSKFLKVYQIHDIMSPFSIFFT